MGSSTPELDYRKMKSKNNSWRNRELSINQMAFSFRYVKTRLGERMCDRQAVLSSGGGQHILEAKSGVSRGVSGAAAEPRGLSGCFHHLGGREGRREGEPSAAQTPDCFVNSTV